MPGLTKHAEQLGTGELRATPSQTPLKRLLEPPAPKPAPLPPPPGAEEQPAAEAPAPDAVQQPTTPPSLRLNSTPLLRLATQVLRSYVPYSLREGGVMSLT